MSTESNRYDVGNTAEAHGQPNSYAMSQAGATSAWETTQTNSSGGDSVGEGNSGIQLDGANISQNPNRGASMVDKGTQVLLGMNTPFRNMGTHANPSELSRDQKAGQQEAKFREPRKIQSLQATNKTLGDTNRRLQRENNNYLNEINRLEQTASDNYAKYVDAYNRWKQAESKYEETQREVERKDREITKVTLDRGKLAEWSEMLENDNIQLRNQVARMSTAQEPLHGQAFYVGEFADLKSDIESWARKMSRQSKTTTVLSFTSEAQEGFLDTLRSWGQYGEAYATWLGTDNRLLILHNDRRWRTILIRHTVGLFLFHGVLNCFVFGRGEQTNMRFYPVEEHLFTQGNLSL